MTKDTITLPDPWGHPMTLAQAMLFRRGEVVDDPCLNFRRGNGRLKLCVHLLDPESPFPEDFFNGSCANCLPNAALRMLQTLDFLASQDPPIMHRDITPNSIMYIMYTVRLFISQLSHQLPFPKYAFNTDQNDDGSPTVRLLAITRSRRPSKLASPFALSFQPVTFYSEKIQSFSDGYTIVHYESGSITSISGA